MDVQPPATSTKIRRLDSLTGLRALAAFVVFLVHIRFVVDGRARDVLDHVGGQGAVGVTFFFILSGFVLTWSWLGRPPQSAGAFYRNRIARIYPSYLVALAGGLVVTLVADGFAPSLVARMLACVTLTQSWVPDTDVYHAVNGVSWSLSCEAFFYLLFPLLVVVIARRARTAWLPIVGALLVYVLVMDRIGEAVGGEVGTWLINAMPATRVAEFCVGIALAVALEADALPRLPVAPCAVVSLAVYVLAGTGGHWLSPYRNAALPMIPFALLIVAFAQADLAGRASLFRRRAVVYLGEISFCFYLVHQLVVRAWLQFGVHSGVPLVVLSFVVCLGVSVAAAAVLHRIVEKPLEQRLRSRRPDGQARHAVDA